MMNEPEQTLEVLAGAINNGTEAVIRENVLLHRFIKTLRLQNQELRKGKPLEVTKEMVFAFCSAISDASVGEDDFNEVKKGLESALSNLNAPLAITATNQERLVYEPVGANEHENTQHKSYCAGWNDCVDASSSHRGLIDAKLIS